MLIRAKPNYQQIRYISLANNGKELIRVDRRGSLIQTIPNKELQEKGDTPYFKNAIKMNPGEIYLSDITLNREFGKISLPHNPMIRAATPVYFNNKIFGILVINMSFSKIFNEMILSTPRELTPYVTNEAGYFLAHPNNKMTFGFDLNNINTIQSVYSDFSLNDYSDRRDVEYTIKANGDVIHIVKAHFDPIQKDRFFAIMLATSYKNLQSGSEQLRFQSFMIMGLLVVISLFVAAILASKLMQPLQLISIAADDIAKGREVSDLPVDSTNEIGELARSFDDMRHQLKDKERELLVSQSHVHHANKMASLGEMASSMAHEINSPIQAINLTAQRVQRQLNKKMDKEDIHASMDKITTSVLKISEIIDSLRKVSRASTNDKFADTHLGDLINDVMHITEERFKVNNIHFDINYHDVSENTIIQCQRLQISQVLINLINNAFDVILKQEEKWIKIDLTKVADKIQISVTDSGPGIADDIRKRIFEPMFTTKEIGKGTGLGLSISRDIILQHNGSFYLDPDAENTTFIVELPVLHV